jgi:hypothetical protein
LWFYLTPPGNLVEKEFSFNLHNPLIQSGVIYGIPRKEQYSAKNTDFIERNGRLSGEFRQINALDKEIFAAWV